MISRCGVVWTSPTTQNWTAMCPESISESVFEVADPLLLRLAAWPAVEAGRTWSDIDVDDPTCATELINYALTLGAHPWFREAVAVSSPALSTKLDRVADGAPATGRELRKLALSLTRYAIRMSSRPTPFGLLAAAGPGRFGSRTDAAAGPWRPVARADMGWLRPLVAEWEQQPDVLAGLRLSANELGYLRAGRLYVPSVPPLSDTGEWSTTSVRHTLAVSRAIELTRRPTPYPRLLDLLCAEFPAVPRQTIVDFVYQLITNEVLHTDLRAPLNGGDPLEHVLRLLPPSPPRRKLRTVRGRLAAYATASADALRVMRETAGDAMQEVSNRAPMPRVDLIHEPTITVPRSVAREIERVADMLWRAATPVPPTPALRRYQDDFLDRYGLGRAVPIRELLDPDSGLGPLMDRPTDTAHALGQGPRTRDDLLVEMATEAARDRAHEIVIDDELIEQLGADEPRPPRDGFELCFELFAREAVALDRGEFRLVLSRRPWLPLPGATAARFAPLFGSAAEDIAAIAWSGTAGTGTTHVQLCFQPLQPRAANVAEAPYWLADRLVVGAFADRTEAGQVHIDDLAIAADERGLFVVGERAGGEVRCSALNMLDVRSQAPAVIRLLSEISDARRRVWRPWVWGMADRLPYLPRIRTGRTILSPARWRPRPIPSSAMASTYQDWRKEFDRWRSGWNVPDSVRVTTGDHALDLRLDVPLHQRLLYDELRRRPSTLLHEKPADSEFGTGWIGGHANEIVVGLAPRPDVATQAVTMVATTRSRGAGMYHPGGDWLYLKLYGAREHQREILTEHLPALLHLTARSVDRWHYVRHFDHGAHLRIRLHAQRMDMAGGILTVACDWASKLVEAGQANRFMLETYEQEWERYGGEEAFEETERIFAADSELVLEQLVGMPDADPRCLAAANHLDLLSALLGADVARWVSAHIASVSTPPPARLRRATAALVAASDAPPSASDPLVVLRRERRHAAHRYIAALGSKPPNSALLGFVHMHHNRLLGPDRITEAETCQLLRYALRAVYRPATSAGTVCRHGKRADPGGQGG